MSAEPNTAIPSMNPDMIATPPRARRPDLEHMARQWSRWRRRADRVSLLWIEITEGLSLPQAQGRMPALAALLRQSLRATDEVSPVGEHAFAVLLAADAADAPQVAERLHPLLANALGRPVRIGLASFPQDGRSGYELALVAQASLLEDQTSSHSLRM